MKNNYKTKLNVATSDENMDIHYRTSQVVVNEECLTYKGRLGVSQLRRGLGGLPWKNSKQVGINFKFLEFFSLL